MDITGASGAIPRSDMQRMEAHARLYYEEIRKRTDDISKIASNTGFLCSDIANIKKHMFINEYDLGSKRLSRFDPDYDQAVSWQRLSDGREIHEMDIVMLKHELMEYDLMVNRGMSYREAHNITEQEYNYSQYVRALNEKEGLF